MNTECRPTAEAELIAQNHRRAQYETIVETPNLNGLKTYSAHGWRTVPPPCAKCASVVAIPPLAPRLSAA